MHRLHWGRTMAAGAVVLAGLTLCTPSVPAMAATHLTAQRQSPVAVALQKQILQRFPHATVAISPISGTASYVVNVTLTNQKGATLSGGVGATVLMWYMRAFPNQTVYVLFSREQDAGVSSLWEYEYRTSGNVLHRYHYTSGPAIHAYPWTSWKISRQGIVQAAQVGQWPKNGVQHVPPAMPAPEK